MTIQTCDVEAWNIIRNGYDASKKDANGVHIHKNEKELDEIYNKMVR